MAIRRGPGHDARQAAVNRSRWRLTRRLGMGRSWTARPWGLWTVMDYRRGRADPEGLAQPLEALASLPQRAVQLLWRHGDDEQSRWSGWAQRTGGHGASCLRGSTPDQTSRRVNPYRAMSF